MMTRTKAATNWLGVARRYMITPAYRELLAKANRIARERKASRLGKVHCEIALERMSQEE